MSIPEKNTEKTKTHRIRQSRRRRSVPCGVEQEALQHANSKLVHERRVDACGETRV
tara:strand:- start:74 stop:241 length:168 start_codon:yes stop_codon:yes gene_type:complete